MKILGITSPLSWNNAAAIIIDGQLVAAVEEERCCRVKNAPRIPPLKSTKLCLEISGLDFSDIDYIAVGLHHPLKYCLYNLKAEILANRWNTLHLQIASSLEYYILISKMKTAFEKIYPPIRNKKWIFVPHHKAHAASACRVSGFDKANVLTLDGNGEDDCGGLFSYNHGQITTHLKIPIEYSIGLLYSCTTDCLGFIKHSQEGKTMGLAAYGNPIIPLDDFFHIKGDWFEASKHWSIEFYKRFGSLRNQNTPLSDGHKNLAASVQKKVEEISSHILQKLQNISPIPSLAMAGGVTLNCDMNAKLLQSGLISDIFIQPAAHDAGTALGAAFELNNKLGGKDSFVMDHPYWGPEYSNDDIELALKSSMAVYEYYENIEQITAELINKGLIIGWFQGRMEWGPRSLGARSIVAHPGLPNMKDKINIQVKHRETWRPFAPSILEEDMSKYLIDSHKSPFMLLTFKVKKEYKDNLIAAMHVDDTARVQSVSATTNPKYHSLISEFKKLSGIGAVLNTSFNDSGEPIVMTPKDALRTFFSTGLDALAIGNFLLRKSIS